jgi:hypothetical protein
MLYRLAAQLTYSRRGALPRCDYNTRLLLMAQLLAVLSPIALQWRDCGWRDINLFHMGGPLHDSDSELELVHSRLSFHMHLCQACTPKALCY